MAYDEYTADRVARILTDRKVNFYGKKMFGGICYMVEEKMCCGILFNKKKDTDLMMARVGEEAYPEAIKRDGAQPMEFTGRPMRGYIFVIPDGYDTDEDLEYWVDLCLAFNPMAKASKKKVKKSKS